jgi:hypothetical protein
LKYVLKYKWIYCGVSCKNIEKSLCVDFSTKILYLKLHLKVEDLKFYDEHKLGNLIVITFNILKFHKKIV